MRRTLFVAAALAFTACSDSTGPDAAACDPALLQLGAVPGDTVTTASGLRYIDIRAGSGTTATIGHAVRAHYAGYLTNGTRFDTSCSGGEETVPIAYTLPGAVIAGFWQGTVGMSEGGIRRLIIPPALGYGAQGSGSIPANATLIFDIQLHRILND